MKENIYLQRYAWPERLTSQAPSKDLGIIVTIPAYDEPDIVTALKSLAQCAQPSCHVEVHVLLNFSDKDSEKLKAKTNEQFYHLEKLCNKLSANTIEFFIHLKKLPSKHAGVGLARKILMDEAARRFEMVNNEQGIITGFDADCTCSGNYLVSIHKKFMTIPSITGGSIYFEHSDYSDHKTAEAASLYELHLRAYIDGLRWACVPHAFQTIGSSMAVNSKAYQRQGGMNKKKAGEDFYFLHRIIREGNFMDITDVTIYPSPRPSHRVPFGTGKAVNKYLEEEVQYTYNPKSFEVIAAFVNLIEDDIYSSRGINGFPEIMKPFLDKYQFETEISRIKRSSSGKALFKKHFYQWFDGFLTMKLLHYLRDNGFGDVEVKQGAADVYKKITGSEAQDIDLISWFREYDKDNPRHLTY